MPASPRFASLPTAGPSSPRTTASRRSGSTPSPSPSRPTRCSRFLRVRRPHPHERGDAARASRDRARRAARRVSRPPPAARAAESACAAHRPHREVRAGLARERGAGCHRGLWARRALSVLRYRSPRPARARAAGIGRRWRELVAQGLIERDEAASLARHEALLQDLRIRLHYLAGRREDRLVFDVQTALAKQMGFADSAHRRASEAMMQRYYQTAKGVTQLNTILLQNLEARLAPRPDTEPRALNERFEVRSELLHVKREDTFAREPTAILESFLLMMQHQQLRGMTARTLRALYRARSKIDAGFRHDPVARLLFLHILQQPRGIVQEFRRMNQYGILGRYLPEFGRIVGQMQHDLFHVYTVDQHILMVVRNLRRFTQPEFAHEFPLCTELMNGFELRWLLYIAALYHDIAKGRGGDHSELGERDVISFAQRHGLAKEDRELVAFLVENHLAMSHVAQKQDVYDTEVIRAFADKMHTERRMVSLYLFTVADIRGTSP